MASAIPYAASGLGAIFQGIGRSKPQSSTSTYNNTQSGTQEAVLSGKQKKVNAALFNQILEALQRGPQVSQADRNTQRAQINRNFDSADTNLEANLVARGYGESGKFGQGIRDNSLERLKSIQTGEAQLQDSAFQRYMAMIQNAFQFNQPRSFTNNSTSSGTQTGAMSGISPWSTIGSGLSDYSAMEFYRNMMGNNQAPWLSPSQRSALSGGFHIPRIPGCRVAIELYGNWDIRMMIARAWLMTKARNSYAWRALVVGYILTGPVLAFAVRKNEHVRKFFKSLFDEAIRRALNE